MELVRVKIFLQLSTSVIALDPRQCQIYFFKNGYENVYLRWLMRRRFARETKWGETAWSSLLLLLGCCKVAACLNKSGGGLSWNCRGTLIFIGRCGEGSHTHEETNTRVKGYRKKLLLGGCAPPPTVGQKSKRAEYTHIEWRPLWNVLMQAFLRSFVYIHKAEDAPSQAYE